MKLTLFILFLLSTLTVAAPSTNRQPPEGPAGGGGGGGGDGGGGGNKGGSRGRPYGSGGNPDDRANPDPYPGSPGDGCPIPTSSAAYCAGTRYNASLVSTYICGDWRLGPVRLPSMIPLDTFVEFYDRLGGLCPGAFIDEFWDETASPEYWRFPDRDGFALNTARNPIKGEYLLEVGVLVDRFGGEGGTFVSPAAAPYIQRALPPNNLDTPTSDPKIPYNYHLYRVAIPFEVEAGPIRPWFRQPGQGVQYSLKGVTVSEFVAGGYLVAEDPTELIP